MDKGGLVLEKRERRKSVECSYTSNGPRVASGRNGLGKG